MYDFLARHFLTNIRDLSRLKAIKKRNELEKSQWWPREKILQLQHRHLKELLEYAYTHVPYYRNLFDERILKPDDNDSTKNLVRLPILTKQIIRNNFNDLLARDFPQRELLPTRTGGSTGEPLMFFGTKNDRHYWGYAASCRTRTWVGYRVGNKKARFTLVPECESTLKRLNMSLMNFFENTVVFNVNELSTETLPCIVKRLGHFQPKLIQGYPSAIYLLARFLESEGKPTIRPKAIVTGAEQLYDYQRELFRRVFKCDSYSNYSSWEVNNIAAECPEHTGHHIAAENVIIEILDDEGQPVPVGESGRIIVTNLHNYGMPFIRYDIGDVGVISDEVCLCGRGLPLLTKLEGRSTDAIYTRSGNHILGMALPWNFLASLGVDQFQIIQEDYENVTVKLVMNNEYPQRHLDKLICKIKEQYSPLLGEAVNITIEFVHEIVPNRSGKRRFVISKLAPMN